MQMQGDWEVLLNGDPQEIRQLCTWGHSINYFRLWGGVDDWNDCPNDDFRFNSNLFEGQTQEGVWQITYELLSLFNGASTLLEREPYKLSIYKILLEGGELTRQEKRNIPGMLTKPAVSSQAWADDLRKALGTSQKISLMMLAAEHEDIYLFLKFLDQDSSWITYYKILDTLETWERRKGLKAFRSKRKEKKFTCSANNFSLNGFDARHGFQEMMQQPAQVSMTIDEGHQFITGLVKDYLQQAHPQFVKFR
ncbi:hypothetical protein YA0016_20815 [Pseudomonas syringae]|jgi:hypothetical protein|uniref:hypothetical protein n=1 Tax=Pseudomonas TaxID=286 RepID=UPI000209A211|nr:MULTISPECIES: hypothetical protein [Pseudomonas]AVI82393.1 hypothetical protein XJ28_00745 [Pseudomonas syringae pv. tomato]MBI6844163.1 hypothetical protein [Pseudomonas syringae]MDP5167392.1 hypothetical protein [Pseudomonas syringae pv. aptata str. DSM 50252]QBI60516.1 hypothetical protein EIZ61_02830 [Pseudomonas syringae]RMO43761.1 hypothetical protein ALQ40_200144 [Pseudomonas syringae]